MFHCQTWCAHTVDIWCLGWWTWTRGISSYQVPCHSRRMSNRAVYTYTALVPSAFFSSTLPSHLFFSLLSLSSLEPKVEPRLVEVENSESLFLRTSDSDPAPQHLSLCLYFNSLSPSVCTYPYSSSSIPPSLSPLPVPEGRCKEASQSHQCDLI